MGIQGLMTYVGENHNFFNNVKLQNTKIVIDGNNLFHRLYFDSGIDLKHGGEYDLFTDVICKFFEALSLCNIAPYVVFDGGCDCTDKKFETLKQRARKKIQNAHIISRGGGGMLLPLLNPEVFKQVLLQLQVPFVQCHSEADRDIVTLANQWACPVLTLDSDFCIFDLKAGYCPLNYFKWQSVTTPKDHSGSYISAQCFSVENFCKHFNLVNKALLPLFAVLNGNDYVNLPTLETFLARVHIHARTSGSARKKNMRIQGLLNWLSTFSDPEEAMENILKCLKQNEREEVRKVLCTVMDEYTQSEVDLTKFFQNKDLRAHVPIALASKAPEWMCLALMKGELAPFLSDCLILKRAFLQTQVENTGRPSSNRCSLYIRQVIYGLLLCANEPYSNQMLDLSERGSIQAGIGEERLRKMSCVDEFDRYEQTLRKSSVPAVLKGFNANEIYSLQRLPEISLSDRIHFLLDVLQAKPDVLALPAHLQLTVAVTCYWVAHVEPKVTLHHLQALLLCIVTGELNKIIQKPGNSSFDEKSIRMVRDRLTHMKERKQQMWNLDLNVAHVFCQWQSCLLMGIYLNQLLCFPLPVPDITRLYRGTYVHRLYQTLQSMAAAEDLLKGSLIAGEVYHELLHTVITTVPADFFQKKHKSKHKSQHQSQAKLKEKQTTNSSGSLINEDNQKQGTWHDANNRFAALATEEF
ncbi:protein asteroid homolog 1-like isoform X1 [Chiloscyllium plagiosum]|uniref:protein asteroid homolog 1-like isoform X1 n=1 Tax=Chiloscyllium plagiosum TaxID=36176 RepID=UPI001CB8727F|nr:protein asteroid homolog 1-like isoform X1 [Chiloscyllium plagiosum]